LTLFWNNQEYRYKVKEIKEVQPTDIYIEENTTESILTIYTCTPLWTAEKRLVIIGVKIS
jgi:sortase A